MSLLVGVNWAGCSHACVRLSRIFLHQIFTSGFMYRIAQSVLVAMAAGAGCLDASDLRRSCVPVT